MHRLTAIFALALVLCPSAWAGEPGKWKLASDEGAGSRTEHFLFWSPTLKRAILIGGRSQKGGQYVMAFDPTAGKWEGLSAAKPVLGKRQAISSGDAAACDPEGKRIYFLVGSKLHCFDVAAKAWTDLGSDPLVSELTARKMAFAPDGRRIVLVGSEHKVEKCGWMGVLIYDLAAKKWQRLETGSPAQRASHANRVAALEELSKVVGGIRHAWYSHPAGEGTSTARKTLSARIAELAKLPALGGVAAALVSVRGTIESKRMLEALRSARALRRKFESAVEAASPAPPARRNSPLVRDPVNKSLVLFGGDHDDYTTNDTWILNVEKRSWRRAKPKVAPRPRAGHGLVYLAKSKRIALWDGYRHNSTRDYRRHQAGHLPKRELWFYDVKGDTWTLSAAWPAADKSLPARAGALGLGFFGYGSDYRAMALAADAQDNLIFAGAGPRTSGNGRKKARLTGIWTAEARPGPAAPRKSGAAPNSRFERTGKCPASYCEDAAAPTPAGLNALRPNVWTPLPAPPRVPYDAQRRCPYGNAAWNPDGDEILHWGGGHCACSTSLVTHWSPSSNRMVQAYDRDEPYGSNGGGPGGHSLLGRPWVDTHAYQSYGYDYRNKLLVLLKGRRTYLYDPTTMRWLKKRLENPFDGHCYTGHIIPTPHGAVAWAGTRGYMGKEGRGLWLFDGTNWNNIAKPGSVPRAQVDRSASCFDSKRDRVLLFPNSGKSVGPITCYSFAGRKIEKVKTVNPELVPGLSGGQVVYVPHCDWVLALWTQKDAGGRSCHPVYDCGTNKWQLVYLGTHSVGKGRTRGVAGRGRGMVYDTRRKLIYVITEQGGLFGLKLERSSAAKAQQ